MPGPQVEIAGYRETAAALLALSGSVDEMKEVHGEAAKLVEAAAEKEAPVLSGELISTIRSSAQGRTGVIRAGFASTVYAPVIHWGWPGHNIEPDEFIYRAIDTALPEIIVAYDRGLSKLAKQYGLA